MVNLETKSCVFLNSVLFSVVITENEIQLTRIYRFTPARKRITVRDYCKNVNTFPRRYLINPYLYKQTKAQAQTNHTKTADCVKRLSE